MAFLSVFILTGISIFLLSPSAVQAETWEVTTVDPTESTTRANILAPSIAYDASRNPYIAYVYQSYNTGSGVWNPGVLKFAKSSDTGTTWTTSTIDSSATIGFDTSLLWTATNTFIVCYRDETNLDLKFARTTDGGATWTTKTVDSTGDVGTYCAITAFNSDYLIAYYDNTNKDLKYAKSTDVGVTWTTGTIDSTGDVGTYPSIDTSYASSTAILIVSYYDDTNDDLKFAKSVNDGTTWTVSTVDSSGSVGTYSSISDDVSGNYLISYITEDTFELKFAKSLNEGSTWIKSTVDTEQDVYYQTNIGTNVMGDYYISYHWKTPKDDLRIAYSDDEGVTWDKRTVDTLNIAGRYSTMLPIYTPAAPVYVTALMAYSSCDGTYCFLNFAQANGSGDLNGDGAVSVSDYSLFITDYLAFIDDNSVNVRSDFNGDGAISVSDYALFISAYLDYVAG